MDQLSSIAAWVLLLSGTLLAVGGIFHTMSGGTTRPAVDLGVVLLGLALGVAAASLL